MADQLLYVQNSAGVAQNTFTAAQDLVNYPKNAAGNTIAPATIPANTLVWGSQLRVRAGGFHSTTGTPNLSLGVYLNGAAAGTVLAYSGLIVTGLGVSNLPWDLDVTTIVTAQGSTGLVFSYGKVSVATSGTAATTILMPTTAPQTAVAINTGAMNYLTVAATWGTSSASNTITCNTFTVELINP